LLAVFARIHLRNFLGFLNPDTYTRVLLLRSPRGARFSTWAEFGVVPLGVTLRGPDTLPDVPRDVRLGAASQEAAGTAAVLVRLAVGLSVPLGLLLISAELSCRPLDAACSPVDFAGACVGPPWHV
jgi:hypothetical protein